MGLFNKKDSAKKAEETNEVKQSSGKASAKKETAPHDAGSVIANPRITEKAAYAADKNVYTFDIAPRAGKLEVSKAVKAIYNVTPVRINILSVPTKRVYRQKHTGVKGGGKKAYVYLKKGDKIEFV